VPSPPVAVISIAAAPVEAIDPALLI